jgi:outer membrane protein assembly factor BamB
MQVRRFGFLLVPALLILNAVLPSCGGGSSTSTLPTPDPPGPNLVSITVCDGPPPSPVAATPTPTPIFCPGGPDTSVSAGDTATFHANAKNDFGNLIDITHSPTTLWTSDNPLILQSLSNEAGAYAAITEGCACIAASSGGVTSNLVGVTVFASATPECSPCATPIATPAAAAADSPSAETGAAGPPAGVLQWTFNAHAPILGPIAAAADGSVYFVSADYRMHALGPHGHERFNRRALAVAIAPDTGNVYIQGVDAELHALAADGAELWHREDGGGSGPLAVAHDGTLYAAGNDALLSVNPDGALNWRTALGEVAALAPIPGGGVVAGTSGGSLIALTRDGRERWSFAPDGGFSGGIAIAGEVAYAGSSSGTLYEIALDSGAELRRIATDAPVRSGPVAGADGTIYFGADRFYALASDGAIIWRSDLVEVGDAAPLILRGNTVALAGPDGMIARVNADGSYGWGARIKGSVQATGASDLIYLGTDHGTIYAIR